MTNAGFGLIREEASRAKSIEGAVSTISVTAVDNLVIALQVCFIAATLLVVVYLSPRAMKALDRVVIDRLRDGMQRVQDYYNRATCQARIRRCLYCRNGRKMLRHCGSRITEKCSSLCFRKERTWSKSTPTKKKRVGGKRPTRFDEAEDVPEPYGGINPLQTNTTNLSNTNLATEAERPRNLARGIHLPELPAERQAAPTSTDGRVFRNIASAITDEEEQEPTRNRKTFSPMKPQKQNSPKTKRF